MRGLKSLAAAAMGLVALTVAGTASAQYTYVSEFGNPNSVIHRFDLNGNPAPAGNWASGATFQQIEGLEGRGGELVFAGIANGSRGIHGVSKATGVYNGQLTSLNDGNVVFDLKLRNSGNDFVVAQMGVGGTQNQIRMGDFANGVTGAKNVSNNVAPWGVALHPVTGEVYYTLGFNLFDHADGGVFRTSANLVGGSTIDATTAGGGLNGLTSPTGLCFLPNGDLFVVNGGNGSPNANQSFVNRYNYDGNTNSYSFAATFGVGTIEDAFDAEIGPDGNLYVSSEEGACVVKYDLSNSYAASTFIHPGAGGLPRAKTIHFDVNSVVPEPGTWAMFAGMSIAGAGMIIRRRK